jgi:hypothetical protein
MTQACEQNIAVACLPALHEVASRVVRNPASTTPLADYMLLSAINMVPRTSALVFVPSSAPKP